MKIKNPMTKGMCLFVALFLMSCGQEESTNRSTTPAVQDEADVEAETDNNNVSEETVSEKEVEKASSESDQESTTSESTPYKLGKAVVPPAEYGDAVFKEAMDEAAANPNALFSVLGEPQTLFLNFQGAEVLKGFGRGQSFLPCTDSVNVPGGGFSGSQIQQIVGMVSGYFGDANVDLDVTSIMPLSGDFTTVHVGGTPDVLGCDLGQNVLGMAPLDLGNINLNDTAFVFGDGQGNLQNIATAIAHQAGLSFGLQQVDNPSSIMSSVLGGNIEGFLGGNILGGGDFQDSSQILQTLISSFGVVNGGINPDAGTGLPSFVNLPNLPGQLFWTSRTRSNFWNGRTLTTIAFRTVCRYFQYASFT